MSSNLYLKITPPTGITIPGGSTAKGYEKSLEAQAYTLGLNLPVSSGTTVGKPAFQDLTITRYADAASPTLNFLCASGKVLPSMILSVVITNAAGQTQVPLTIEFSNALIRSVSVQDAVGSGSPMETISFTYQKVTWKSTAPDPATGQIIQSVRSWDIATNTGA
jgi:type VI secretion system secreted protein Hcp